VGLSAGAFKQQHDDALAAGMTEFVAKPFDVDQLVAVIARVTRSKLRADAVVTTSRPVSVAAPDYADFIDTRSGLRNWGSIPVFHAQLWRFMELHGDDPRAIVEALDGGAHERVRAAAHKLAGAAEAVALRRIGEVARALEVSADGTSEQRELAGALVSELEQSREVIARYAPGPSQLPRSSAVEPTNENARERARQAK
jgi:HPt (histidine-containing phosphotransfer) domain-containing protein